MKATDQLPMCCNCKKAKALPLTTDMLCEVKGIVSADYSCKKYDFNLFLLKSKRRRNLNMDDFTSEDFAID